MFSKELTIAGCEKQSKTGICSYSSSLIHMDFCVSAHLERNTQIL